MPRPLKNAEGPDAQARMEEAFWECLNDMPFEKITVRHITERAGVNRNTYYYHYDTLWDLAEEAVRHTLLLEFAHMLLDDEATTVRVLGAVGETKNVGERFSRIRLLAGPHGNHRLFRIVQDTIVTEWLRAYGIEENDLTDGARAVIEFVFGGVAALWASSRFTTVEDMASAIATSDLISSNIGALRKELRESALQATAP